MKKFLMILMSLSFTASAFAGQTLTCKKYDEKPGQGFQAKIADRTAEIFYEGKKIADLTPSGGDSLATGGDQQSVRNFSQKVVNGYALTLTSGGFAGITSATIYHGGFAGFTPQAVLDECK